MATSLSSDERYSMRSKTHSSLVALAVPKGGMMDKIICEAALSHSFLVEAIFSRVHHAKKHHE